MFLSGSYDSKIQNDRAYGKEAYKGNDTISHGAGEVLNETKGDHAYDYSYFFCDIIKAKK